MRATEFITEKKHKKQKTKHAAYGPGPYGWYGFDSGYSGDGGGIEESQHDQSAEKYREHLIKTLPQIMKFFDQAVKGWKPSEEQMMAAIETAYTVMKHTGDIKQAGRAMMDELNTLHRMSQGQQGVAEGSEHQQQDLDDVADWMNTTPDKVSVEVRQEPIEKFIKQIREMYGTYDEFPEDEQRTNRILKLLKRGAQPLPVYVEANDPDLFVMEGRHRMVAFWLVGMKSIPVAYVSIKGQQGVAESGNKKEAVRRIQKMLNKKFNANLDIDGILGPLTLQSINKFMPSAKVGLADEPNKTTSVQGKTIKKKDIEENFADGRNPQDKGDAKRHGINTKASVSSLRKTAKQGGRKGQLAHWLANMKAGRAKAK
jgi:hypothetical protein